MGKGIGILLDENGELVVANGTVAIGDVTEQNQLLIILAEKGEIKEAPLLGVGVASFLDDDNISELLREVRANLREDGQKVASCSFENGKLKVVGGYES